MTDEAKFCERDGLKYELGSDKPFTGLFVYNYPDHNLMSEAEYRNGKLVIEKDLEKKLYAIGMEAFWGSQTINGLFISADDLIAARDENFRPISILGSFQTNQITKHYIYILSDEGDIPYPGQCTIAYNPDSTDNPYLLSKNIYDQGGINLHNFQRLIKTEVGRVECISAVLDIANLFVRLYFVGTPVMILHASDEIKQARDSSTGETIPISPEIQHKIHAPLVERSNGDYVVSLYTWGGSGATLTNWQITVTTNASINYEIISQQRDIGAGYKVW